MKKIATNFHVIRVVLSCFFCGLYSRAVNNVVEQGWWNWGGQRTPQTFLPSANPAERMET